MPYWHPGLIGRSVAKHYYNIELVMPIPLEEDEVQQIEEALAVMTGAKRITTEYVDSEG